MRFYKLNTIVNKFKMCGYFYRLFYIVAVVLSLNSNCSAGKRRYDRKQSGYGGQTKPIFRKKVTPTFPCR